MVFGAMSCTFVAAMQFNVYENPNPRMRDQFAYVVDVQRDLLSGLIDDNYLGRRVASRRNVTR